MCETINEVISSIEPYIKQSNIIEDKNNIKLIISLNHPLCKEAIFQIKEKIKNNLYSNKAKQIKKAQNEPIVNIKAKKRKRI